MVPLDLTCSQGHHMTVPIKEGKMIDRPSVPVQTDIQKHADAPQDIRDTIEETNRCFGIDAPLAGACLVRTTLDLFLFALDFTDKYTGTKVEKLEIACKSGLHRNLAPRISEFRSICGLAGEALHAPSSNRPLFSSEWLGHLHTVEGAVRQKWPRRV